jgi:hypothetical protein
MPVQRSGDRDTHWQAQAGRQWQPSPTAGTVGGKVKNLPVQGRLRYDSEVQVQTVTVATVRRRGAAGPRRPGPAEWPPGRARRLGRWERREWSGVVDQEGIRTVTVLQPG